MKKLICMCCGKEIKVGDEVALIDPQQDMFDIGFVVCMDCLSSRIGRVEECDLENEAFMNHYGEEVDDDYDEDEDSKEDNDTYTLC